MKQNSFLFVLVLLLFLGGPIEAESDIDDKTRILSSVCNDDKLMLTMYINGTCEVKSTWEFYLDSVEDSSLIEKGTVGCKGILKTVERKNMDEGSHIALLVVRNGKGCVKNIAESNFTIIHKKSLVSLFTNAGVVIGGCIGIIASMVTMTIQYLFKSKSEKEKKKCDLSGRIACVVHSILQHKNDVDKTIPTPDFVSKIELDEVWSNLKSPVEVFNDIEQIKLIYNLWKDGNFTDRHQKKLEDLLRSIQSNI